MKIAWTACVLDGGTSGISSYIINLLRALGNIQPITLFYSKGNETALNPLPSSIHKIPIPALLENPLLNIAWHNTALPFALRQKGCGLLHVPSIRRIPLIKICPLIATVHDMAPFTLRDKYGFARGIYHRHILSKCIHQCDQILTVSQYTKDQIHTFTGFPLDAIRVVPNGVDSKFFSPMDKNDSRKAVEEAYGISSPFLYYLARLEHPGKNHVRLIEAFEQFKKSSGTPYHLVLAGPDWFGAETIRNRAQESPYSKEIHLLGCIPKNHLPILYSACSLMVFPSLFEGFGLPLLEAMACRSPVICSNSTSLREIAEGRTPMFNPERAGSIAQSLAKALEHPPSEAELDRNLAYAKGFTWENAAEDTLKTYKELYG